MKDKQASEVVLLFKAQGQIMAFTDESSVAISEVE